MRKMVLAAAMVLAMMTASAASAGPVLYGVSVWTAMTPCSVGTPYKCASYDGPVSHIQNVMGGLDGWEYVADGGFEFADWPDDYTMIYTATGFVDVITPNVVGSFRLQTNHDGDFLSHGIGWGHFLLMRRAVSPTMMQYRMGVEDLPFLGDPQADLFVSDDDYTDVVIEAFQARGGSVPEPASLVLFSAGLFAFARRIRRK